MSDAIEIGGGSGGGPDLAPTGHTESIEGAFSVEANQVQLLSRPPAPPAVPGPHVITILATGMGFDGLVNIRGSQGVRITGGPPPLPATSDAGTDGVEIVVGETSKVTIMRGEVPEVDQKIEMTPTGITIDAGMGTLTIKSGMQLTLSVAEGLSQITLGPEGVTIQGILVQIN